MEPFVYDELRKREKDDWWFVGRRKIISSLLRKHLSDKKNLSIVDIGCGAGEVIDLLRSYGRVIGVDNDKQIVEFNKKKGRDVLFGDINRLDFPEKTFDLAVLLEVLEHLDNDMVGLREVYRVLKLQGLSLVTVPAFSFLWSSHDFVAHHKRRYTKKELEKKLLKAGFKIIKISYFNTFLFPAIFILRTWKNFFNKEKNRSDFITYPAFFNHFLKIIFSSEAIFLENFNFPFGVSLLALVEKNEK